MSSATTPMSGRLGRALRAFETPVGKKAIMAISGLILFGYIVAHVLGNLQIFLGPAAINKYSEMLHGAPALLWGARVILLAAVVAHVVSATQLALAARAARPTGYRVWRATRSSYASRTMIWSGVIIGSFVVYHVLDLTTGHANPRFVPGDVYGNLVASFQRPAVAIAYVVSVSLLGLHLRHGFWSMFQSVGASHPAYTPKLKRLAAVLALAITVGFVAVPASVLLGLVK